MKYIDKWIKPRINKLYKLIVKKSKLNGTATLIYSNIIQDLRGDKQLYFDELVTQLVQIKLVERSEQGTKITFKNVNQYATDHKNIFIDPTLDNDVIVNKVAHDLIYKTVMNEIIQSGGNIDYYNKYVKYKTKYFKLKS